MSGRKWFVLIGVIFLCLITILGYAGDLVLIRGWSYKQAYYDGVSGHEGTAEGIDINGEVGYPINPNGDVSGPCATSHGGNSPCYVGSPLSAEDPAIRDQWLYDFEVVSGKLPPGVSILTDRNQYGRISGVPTERGHWIVTMKVKNIKFEGKYYDGFTQELRFHITGTGKVIE